jgi:tetratricopeptide (TPR) repeat protein
MAAAIVVAAAAVPPAQAEDVVHVSLGDNPQSRTRMTGEILDYTGRELVLRIAGGKEHRFPGDKVFLVETERSAEHLAADAQYDEGQFRKALELYAEAQRKEPRRWVRRQILAQIVQCHAHLADFEAAGQYFLTLLSEDAETPYFDCFPLAWSPREPSPGLERRCLQWLQSNLPAAALLGASHLLPTPHRSAALSKLASLKYDRDRRISGLARAQEWRAGLAEVTPDKIAQWLQELERVPPPLRAGPYYVLGDAWSRVSRPEQAALCYLRVPLLYPRQRLLAARCLLDAGRELGLVGESDEARRLYREVIDRYPESPDVSEASRRLQEAEERLKPSGRPLRP